MSGRDTRDVSLTNKKPTCSSSSSTWACGQKAQSERWREKLKPKQGVIHVQLTGTVNSEQGCRETHGGCGMCGVHETEHSWKKGNAIKTKASHV